MSGSSAEGERPVPSTPAERLNSIDALRGLALFGVLAINLETDFRVSIFQQFAPGAPDRGLSRLVDGALEVLVDMKAFALFSLLFGVGLAIQFERLSHSPGRSVLLFRRLLALLAFGLIHIVFVWDGDILTEYAVAGLIVLPLLFGARELLAAGAAGFLVLYVCSSLPPLVPFPSQAWIADQLRVLGAGLAHGGYLTVMRLRLGQLPGLLPLHLDILARTLGLFLLGALSWRLGLWRHAARYRTALWLAGALAVVLGLIAGLAADGRDYSGWPDLGGWDQPVRRSGEIVLALGYAALVLAAATTPTGARLLRWAEPAGRMAFTNYILQSLILGFVFYGYGLGLYGKVDAAAGVAMVLALYLAQVIASRLWLKRFRFGPLEWLWRTLMYGKPPRFHAVPAAGIGASVADGAA